MVVHAIRGPRMHDGGFVEYYCRVVRRCAGHTRHSGHTARGVWRSALWTTIVQEASDKQVVVVSGGIQQQGDR